MDTDRIRRGLADIDNHVEAVAQRNAAGSDLNELAFAVHNLIALFGITLDGLEGRQ